MSTVPPTSPIPPSVPQAPAAPGGYTAPPGAPAAPAAPVTQEYVQPVTVPAAPAPQVQAPAAREIRPAVPPAVYIYSHSPFFYWWPVWLTGYIMAVLTWMHGEKVQIGTTEVWFDRSKNTGVLFTLVFFLVILITNVTVRGLASVVVLLALAFTAVCLAYFGLWEDLFNWMGQVAIYMNMGFYVFFSTMVFLVWAFSVFIYDHMSYWRVTPGQMTYEHVIGGAAKSYDTRGMVFEKRRKDLFRHWVVGLGSGDIQISTTGAKRETIDVPNVLFVDSKVAEIQKMIAMQPDQFTAPLA
jgi:hypothetical protein